MRILTFKKVLLIIISLVLVLLCVQQNIYRQQEEECKKVLSSAIVAFDAYQLTLSYDEYDKCLNSYGSFIEIYSKTICCNNVHLRTMIQAHAKAFYSMPGSLTSEELDLFYNGLEEYMNDLNSATAHSYMIKFVNY